MFYRAWAFNQPLSLDTSSVTKMNGMFLYASAFNQPLSLDTSSVTDMADMFYARSSRAPLPPQPAQFAATLLYATAHHTSRACSPGSHVALTLGNSSLLSLAGYGLLVQHQQAYHPLRVGGQLRLCLRWL